jgi:hypothetical protein
MTAEAGGSERAREATLSAAALAIVCLAVALLLPAVPTIRFAAALIGVWLLFAALIRFAGHGRGASMAIFRRPIPIRFSGTLGRFTLRPRGDGRRVEVRAGAEVVAEAIATDERDELVVDLEVVEDDELDAFGTAIGKAIEMAAAADEGREVLQRTAASQTRERAPRTSADDVLESIGTHFE